ncbi:hypothetical protein NDU88_001789 [Pleurodeles waltl]|uniref:Uncharacterized protein n=1 Tax=Pleurodeles waltl TaxID=8319 RepID=A0AAV7KTS9_PLEWA|nr:hypothetical protein NDU88_001789 [Pleurodeles waltl]
MAGQGHLQPQLAGEVSDSPPAAARDRRPLSGGSNPGSDQKKVGRRSGSEQKPSEKPRLCRGPWDLLGRPGMHVRP